MFKIIKDSYDNGSLLSDFIISKTIILLKKSNATEYGNCRTIALISHASKILLNIVKNRLRENIEQNISEDQFRFRKVQGTKKTILVLRQILERRITMNIKTTATFIDLEKALNKVDWRIGGFYSRHLEKKELTGRIDGLFSTYIRIK